MHPTLLTCSAAHLEDQQIQKLLMPVCPWPDTPTPKAALLHQLARLHNRDISSQLAQRDCLALEKASMTHSVCLGVHLWCRIENKTEKENANNRQDWT